MGKLFNVHLAKARRHRGMPKDGKFIYSLRAFVPPREVLFRASLLILLFAALNFVAAQEDFGNFGFGESGGFGFSGGSSGLSVNIGGEVSAEFTFFYDELGSAERIKNIRLGDIFLGKLNFSAGSSAAQAVINLKLVPVFDGSSPVSFDEAYVRAFFGPVTIEGGLRKLNWGKADSFGPLDLINPLDYTDLTKLSDPKSIKLARPMIHSSWAMGSFSKLEAVFVPTFQGHSFATKDRWAPSQINNLIQQIPALVDGLKAAMPGIYLGFPAYLDELNAWQDEFNVEDYYYDHNHTLKYAQAGMRFTTTIGSSDLGFQYYFGRLQRPRIKIALDDYVNELLTMPSKSHPEKIIDIDYNYYHQIAADYAMVLAGFNLRAEAGVNITKDLDGRDGAVENPSLVWSLGFDRDLLWGINLNLQGTGRIRLFQSKLGDNLIEDCEAGSNASSTRITGIVSKKFFRDELELKVSGLWGIEDRDFLVMPAIIWSRNDVGAEISAGFFGGDKKGELGQYGDNGFLKLLLSYKF